MSIPHCITPKQLVVLLNTKFPQGKIGKKSPFTVNDIVQYLRRGNIPYRYGGNILITSKDKTKVIVTIGQQKT